MFFSALGAILVVGKRRGKMEKRNYQKELDSLIEKTQKEGEVPSLLLHSCCAPCSSYVLEYLSKYFAITLFYYNPNISPKEEYEKRADEQRRLLEEMPFFHPVSFIEGKYEPARFLEAAAGLEGEPEGGGRCARCFALRLEETAKEAKRMGCRYFATTLSVSPHKNAPLLNEIEEGVGKEAEVLHLPGDFKKREGYKRSIELSAKYGLYRQDYCGCIFSKEKSELTV